ncbi:MAG: DnaA N-terminal domain-containing protein, partial [Chloroflexota bacterium]
MNSKQIWQAALGELQLELSRPVYETYLKRTALVSAEGDTYLIGTPSTFVKEWIEERLLARVVATLTR